MLLDSSKTSILVNVNPGPLFPCKWGLRQVTLYPHILLSLWLTCCRRSSDRTTTSDILLPTSDDQPCTTLQYTNDILILLTGHLSDASCLKSALGLFSSIIGLKINFNKSVAVPMHMDDDHTQQNTTP